MLIERTWLATDDCGNTATCIQIITVQDTTSPVITCPADVVLDCPADTTAATNGVATATDQCDADVDISHSDVVTDNCGNTMLIERTWLATDDCGNTATCIQIITVQDTTAPIIVCPADVVLDCPADTTAATNGVATATDQCDSDVDISHSDVVTDNCGNTMLIERTWLATDDCGNTATCIQIITVQDTTAPIIICPADVVLDCPADTTAATNGVATATDQCDADVDISHSDIVTDNCGNTMLIERTWLATDDCGNTATCIQIITVQDTTAPIIVCPADVVLDCPADTTAATNGVATATDQCDNDVDISHSDIVTDNCGNTMLIERTWLATDDCGNTATCIQIITVQDTTAPIIVCPADVVLDCPADTTAATNGVATATDQCDSDVDISHSDIVTDNCGNTMLIERTWLATDDCGNTATCIQIITVQDTTSPVITCPADVVLDCPADTTATTNGVATATDQCDSDVDISHSDIVTDNCGNTMLIERTWLATDDCGNTATCIQIITVQDTTSPVITCPADVVLDCPADTTAATNGVATATDQCDSDVDISHSDVVTDNCGNTMLIERTWLATDDCGNTATCIQIITVQDTTAPIIVCPADVVLDCPADTTAATNGVATATDQCDSDVDISHSDIVTDNCGNTMLIERTWLATDDCGNTATCIQIITVQDTTAPIIVCPADVVLDCPADTTAATNGVATATDQCDSDVDISHSDIVTDNCGNTMLIERTWLATDDCGNTATCIQIITVQDTTAPIIVCPADVVLDCPADTTAATNGVATATDQCDSDVDISHSDIVTDNCGNTMLIERTWLATDDCGNTATCIQIITVQDTTAPIIVCPADVVLDCPADTTAATNGVATATDQCDSDVDISHSDVVTDNCGNTMLIERTWLATDDCGNTATCIQIITVQDTTSPVITCPADVVLDCPADTTAATNGVATATDQCDSDVDISHSDIVTDNCGNTMLIERTWLATDDCGNTATCIQIITVQDTTAPIIVCPADVVLDCPADTTAATNGVATATDQCDSDVDISHSDIVTDNCGNTMLIERTWLATDDCGNTATCIQIIMSFRIQLLLPVRLSCRYPVRLMSF